MDRLTQLLTMLKEDPKSSFIIFAIAKEYEGQNEIEKAINEYNKLKSIDPNYVGLYFHLGNCYKELEEKDKAISTFDEGIKIANELGDHHALAELKNEKVNLEMDL